MKTSTKIIGSAAALCLTLCALACDSDEAEIACSKSGWGADVGEQVGGDFAVAVTPGPGGAWSMNFDSLTNKKSDRVTCGMTSLQPVETGVHDNFTCQRATGEGAQESWSAAKFTDIDLRPTITVTSRDSGFIKGTIEGVALNTAIEVDAGGTPTARPARYVPFKVAFTATYNPGQTCDSGLSIEERAAGCTAELLRKACNGSPSCKASGTAPDEVCASATETIDIPAMPDGNKCVKVSEFIRDNCQ